MNDFIGIETYYDNEDTGVTWFYNDMKISEEDLLRLMTHVTQNEKYELTTNENGDFEVLKNKTRDKEKHFNSYGCSLWGKESKQYPGMLENMAIERLPDHSISPISKFVKELISQL